MYLLETEIVQICMYILVTSKVLYFTFLQWVTRKGIRTLTTKSFLRIYCVRCTKLFETFVNTIRLLWLHAIAKFETNPATYREVTKHLVQLLKSFCIENEVTWPLNYNLYQVKSQHVNRSELLYTRAILFKAGRRNSFVFDISGNENVSRVQFTQYSVL